MKEKYELELEENIFDPKEALSGTLARIELYEMEKTW